MGLWVNPVCAKEKRMAMARKKHPDLENSLKHQSRYAFKFS